MAIHHNTFCGNVACLAIRNGGLGQSAPPRLRLTRQSRSIISHRGPMENAHRFGKRKMTGAISPATQPATLWHFEVLSDTTSWQWEPPTTPEQRRIRARQWTVSKLCNKFLSWLEMPDHHESFLTPPAEKDPESDNISEFSSLSEALDDVRLQFSTLSLRDAKPAKAICREFCEAVKDLILDGKVTPQDMISSLQPFDSSNLAGTEQVELTHMLLAMLRSSMALTLTTTEKNNAGAIPREFWDAFLTHVLNTTEGKRYQHLFALQRLFIYMPSACRSSVSQEALFKFYAELVIYQASRPNLTSGWITMCRHAGRILSQLDMDQWQALSPRVSDFVERADINKELRRRCRFSWLLIKAYSSKLTDIEFVMEYGEFREHAPTDRFRTWLLALARLHTSGFISIIAHRRLIGRGYEHYGFLRRNWINLVHALLQSNKTQPGIASLCATLTDIGETWQLIWALVTTSRSANFTDRIQTVMRYCDKFDVVLALRIALPDPDECELLLAPWRLSSRDEFLIQIMTYPKAESNMWRVMEEDCGNTDAKMELIDIISYLYTRIPGLTKGMRMRRVMRASYCQRVISGTVTPSVIRDLVDVVTLDLEEGLWGHTRLLALVNGLVREFIGEQEADEMQEQIDTWRQVIDETPGRFPVTQPPPPPATMAEKREAVATVKECEAYAKGEKVRSWTTRPYPNGRW